eukprot:Opistho-2@6985
MPSTPPDLSRLSMADRAGQRLHAVIGGKITKPTSDFKSSLKPATQSRLGSLFIADLVEEARGNQSARDLLQPIACVPAVPAGAVPAAPAVVTSTGPRVAPECARILGNLLDAQAKFHPPANYLKKVQKDEITEAMRRDIVEWLHKLNCHFEFHPETFTLAVNYFDRMLSSVKVKPSHVQLIAVTCLLIAGKMQEAWDAYPTLRELAVASNNAFSCNDIMRMEKIVLGKLGWDTNAVSPHVVLHQLMAHLPTDADTKARIVAEAEAYINLSCYEYGFLRFLPSTIACCAVASVLARRGRVEDKQLLLMSQVLTRTPVDAAEECFQEMRMLSVDVMLAL